MHPAPSIVFFTTASGAGYGLLFLAGLAVPLGAIPPDRWLGLATLGLALVLITAGLVSSTFHLGHPERAWRALSQWRSSWLSREGVLALATYPPAVLFALGWAILGRGDGAWALFGLLAAAGALATVACTAMIYASLKPIRQWRHPLVPPLYLAFGLMTGALWLAFLLAAFGRAEPWVGWLALASILLAWGLKGLYWLGVGKGGAASTPESATGLGAIGRVRLLDAPHTEENYLLKEMGYRVARKHAARLRAIALLSGCLLALAATGGTLLFPSPALALLAALFGSLGVVVERWLFFAEARHTVTLYYGAPAA